MQLKLSSFRLHCDGLRNAANLQDDVSYIDLGGYRHNDFSLAQGLEARSVDRQRVSARRQFQKNDRAILA